MKHKYTAGGSGIIARDEQGNIITILKKEIKGNIITIIKRW